MSSLVEILLAALDVVKTELAALKFSSMKVILAALLALAGALLLLAGVALLMGALYIVLRDRAAWPPDVVLLVLGLAVMAFAGVLLWIGNRQLRA